MARSYASEIRDANARQTRVNILDAAGDLLQEGGFGAMTIAQLAKSAQVSPQTVYNTVGGKAQVVKAVYDRMLAGDDEPVPMSRRPGFVAVRSAVDADSYGLAYAQWTAGIFGRVGRLLGRVLADRTSGDADLHGFLEQIDTERRIGNGHSIAGLVESGVLALPVQQRFAIDGVWTLTAPEVFRRLVLVSGWTEPHYTEWLSRQLAVTVADAARAVPER